MVTERYHPTDEYVDCTGVCFTSKPPLVVKPTPLSSRSNFTNQKEPNPLIKLRANTRRTGFFLKNLSFFKEISK